MAVRFLLITLFFCDIFGALAFAEQTFADNGRITTRRYGADSPPAIEEIKTDGKKSVIRIYRRVDQNATQQNANAKNEFKIFVGAGLELFSRSRAVEIDSKNNGAQVRLCENGEVVTAQGGNYDCTERKTANAPSAEIGVTKGDRLYFGAKAALQDDFVELCGFAGARMDALIAGFTPIAQFSGSIGYENSGGGIRPDNFSIGLGAGLERFIAQEFSVNALAFYRYRVWREMEKIYGDERWRDGEFGASIGARFYF